MSSFTLKIIAVIAMVIDHCGAIFLSEYQIFRIIGRISFPIFCFLLVEGYHHTKNVYKYLARLLLFAIISEPFFDKLFYGDWIYKEKGNVFITLSFGLVFMIISSKLPNVIEKYIVFAVCLMLASFIPMDYGIYGIAMIGGFYFLRDKKLVNVIYQGFINMLVIKGIQTYGVIGAVITTFYNGKKGCSKFKYDFYILYPLHLLILLVITQLAK
ncbi:MAG: hypothetical protein IJC76_03130 [Lachnospiraceae bacterium]|nr:hypothetical protein [Lachnospiraceae bacterium]